jgi:hypothetical protein
VTTRWIVISLRVRVPVLSEQMADAEPSVSTDVRRLTIALRLAIRCTPSARTTESTAGSPSGTAATASDTPTSSTSATSDALWTPEVSRIEPVTMAAMATTATVSARPIRSISSCSGVRGCSMRPSSRATLPISVAIPVAVTTALPRPAMTEVPLKTMSTRSASAAVAGCASTTLSTGSLSPVSAASETISDAAATSRPSALTASPSASTSTSPGTTSVAGMRCSRPSRRTAAVGAAMRCRAATACSARASWTYPSTALSRRMARITTASNGTPAAPSAAQAASDTTTAASSR